MILLPLFPSFLLPLWGLCALWVLQNVKGKPWFLRQPIPSTFLLLAFNICLVRQPLPTYLPQASTALLVGSGASHSRHLTHQQRASWCSATFKTLNGFKQFSLPFLYVGGTCNECSNLNSTLDESQKNFQQKVFDIATHFPIFRHKEWCLKS